MIIPKKIKIGGFQWQVFQDEKVVIEGNVFASTHYRKQKLFIDPSETQQKKEQSFLHEIIHCIFWQTGIDERMKGIEKINEEEIVRALSNGLYQVLVDNKLLKK